MKLKYYFYEDAEQSVKIKRNKESGGIELIVKCEGVSGAVTLTNIEALKIAEMLHSVAIANS